MYAQPQLLPLTTEQIDRIQLAGRIVEVDHALKGTLASLADRWWRKELSDEAFADMFPIAAREYSEFKQRFPTLPI